MKTKPTIALTMGDPAGVGAEVVVKALADPHIAPLAHWIICGDSRVLALAEKCTATHLRPAEVRHIPALEPFANFQFGKLDAQCGAAAVEYVRVATEMCRSGEAG